MRWLLDTDDDGHWYLVPESARDMFTACVENETDLPASVISLNRHPNAVTFTSPEVNGVPVFDPIRQFQDRDGAIWSMADDGRWFCVDSVRTANLLAADDPEMRTGRSRTWVEENYGPPMVIG